MRHYNLEECVFAVQSLLARLISSRGTAAHHVDLMQRATRRNDPSDEQQVVTIKEPDSGRLLWTKVRRADLGARRPGADAKTARADSRAGRRRDRVDHLCAPYYCACDRPFLQADSSPRRWNRTRCTARVGGSDARPADGTSSCSELAQKRSPTSTWRPSRTDEPGRATLSNSNSGCIRLAALMEARLPPLRGQGPRASVSTCRRMSSPLRRRLP